MFVVDLLSLCRSRRGVAVFLDESCFLRDHVGDAADDGIRDAELLVNQLVGFGVVPAKGEERVTNAQTYPPDDVIISDPALDFTPCQ